MKESFSCSSYYFQNTYFFGAKLLLSSHFLRTGSSLGQLLFGTATFLADELLRIKISTEELLSGCSVEVSLQKNKYSEKIGGTSAQHQLLQKSYIFEKVNF